MNLYQRIWDCTRCFVRRRRILATTASEGRKLAAIYRAWERSCK